MNAPTKIIIGIIVAAGLFYGGYAYGSALTSKSQSTSSTYTGRVRTASTTNVFGGGFGAGGGATVGTVVSKDSTSITIALKSGSVVIFYATSTPVMKTTSGTPDDIVPGENIAVIGTTNSDGSIIANTIQIRPAQNQ